MAKTFRSILIDPVSQKITYTQTTGTLSDTLAALSFPGHACDEMESVRFFQKDFMCVDAAAAITARLPSFSIGSGDGRTHTIYGRALIVGATPSGDPATAKVVMTQFMDNVVWGDKAVAIMWKMSDGNNVAGVA